MGELFPHMSPSVPPLPPHKKLCQLNLVQHGEVQYRTSISLAAARSLQVVFASSQPGSVMNDVLW